MTVKSVLYYHWKQSIALSGLRSSEVVVVVELTNGDSGWPLRDWKANRTGPTNRIMRFFITMSTFSVSYLVIVDTGGLS